MKKAICWLMPALAGLVLSSGCSSSGGNESVAEQSQAAGTCPTYLNCPYSVPNYPTFMYAINGVNNNTAIRCYYRNQAYQTTYVDNVKDPTCSHCCPTGYCPNEELGQVIWQMQWSCHA
jgi:hypothetical protein